MKKIYSIIVFTLIASILWSCCGDHSNENLPVKDTLTKTSLFDSLSKVQIIGNRLTPEILWQFGRVSDAQLSPDGKWVLYGIKRYDASTNKGYQDLFKISSQGGEPIQMTSFEGTEYNGRWHPDGKAIGFLSAEEGSNQLWEMDYDGNNKKRVSDFDYDINSFEYSPTGDKILYTDDVKLHKTANELHADLPLADVRIINDLMYRHWDHWHDFKYSHIFVGDLANDSVVNCLDIMKDETFDAPLSPYFDNEEITWSPDGKIVAFSCKKMSGREAAESTNADIYFYHLESKQTENITEGLMGYDKYPVFSPDGKKIAWQCMLTPGYESDQNRLYIYDLETKEKLDYTKAWNQNVSNHSWSPTGDKIFFISGIKATHQLFSIDLTSKEITQLTSGQHDYTAYKMIEGNFIATRMSMSSASEIYSVSGETGQATQLTFTNKNIYDAIEMGKVEERWVKTFDSRDMLVWIIYPPGFDQNKQYPALLYCQGGPQSAVSQFFSFRWNFQIMAANDYIIVAPNRRGLPSFGQDWNAQISGDYGGKNMKDYLIAIDAVKKESYVDENRLGAVGASYGGYSVLWLAGNHQKRFKAFISHCGIFNFESMYGSTEETFFVNHDIEGPYWNLPTPKSYSFSPHKFVQNWDTPIMLITGGRDFRIPYTETLQAFNVARLRGIEAKLLFFPDESHFVVKPQNSILWQREFFGWLDKHLK